MKVESWKLQPCDRRYKSKGKKREEKMMILGGVYATASPRVAAMSE